MVEDVATMEMIKCEKISWNGMDLCKGYQYLITYIVSWVESIRVEDVMVKGTPKKESVKSMQ